MWSLKKRSFKVSTYTAVSKCLKLENKVLKNIGLFSCTKWCCDDDCDLIYNTALDCWGFVTEYMSSHFKPFVWSPNTNSKTNHRVCFHYITLNYYFFENIYEESSVSQCFLVAIQTKYTTLSSEVITASFFYNLRIYKVTMKSVQRWDHDRFKICFTDADFLFHYDKIEENRVK